MLPGETASIDWYVRDADGTPIVINHATDYTYMRVWLRANGGNLVQLSTEAPAPSGYTTFVGPLPADHPNRLLLPAVATPAATASWPPVALHIVVEIAWTDSRGTQRYTDQLGWIGPNPITT
jgi:hypothetical protein